MCDHRHLASGSSNSLSASGDIDHVQVLSDDIGHLFSSDDYSDVTLTVQGRQFSVHKVILAARSEYFRALLFGGMRESQPDTTDIELCDTKAQSFEYLLKYVYTGQISLQSMKDGDLLDLLGLANKYGFQDLQAAMSEYLKVNLSLTNVCAIYDMAHMYQLNSLSAMCLEYMDMNAAAILQHSSFLDLSEEGLTAVISRTSFCAPEAEVFDAVVSWSQKNPSIDIASIFVHVRFALMTFEELLVKVRASALVNPDTLLDAVTQKHQSRDMELDYRGYKKPEDNVAETFGTVIQGEGKEALLDGDHHNYDLDHGFTRHLIDEPSSAGLVVKLRRQCIINTIRLLLWDRDTRSYSYYIQVSMDQEDWVTVVDYTKYLCRSWQTLHFPARVVRYIKVVGTHNTVNRVFHAVSLQALFTEAKFNVQNGLLVPQENVATIAKNAFVIEGVSRCRNALINGDFNNYDWDSGYTCHQLNSGAIVVQLAQPFIVDSIRLLLWDCDDRSYSYMVWTSVDQATWSPVADKSDVQCRSWQMIRFYPRPTSFIKIVGIKNTANEVFHCVHFECPAAVDTEAAPPPEEDGSTAGTSPTSATSPVVAKHPPITTPPALPATSGPVLLAPHQNDRLGAPAGGGGLGVGYPRPSLVVMDDNQRPPPPRPAVEGPRQAPGGGISEQDANGATLGLAGGTVAVGGNMAAGGNMATGLGAGGFGAGGFGAGGLSGGSLGGRSSASGSIGGREEGESPWNSAESFVHSQRGAAYHHQHYHPPLQQQPQHQLQQPAPHQQQLPRQPQPPNVVHNMLDDEDD